MEGVQRMCRGCTEDVQRRGAGFGIREDMYNEKDWVGAQGWKRGERKGRKERAKGKGVEKRRGYKEGGEKKRRGYKGKKRA